MATVARKETLEVKEPLQVAAGGAWLGGFGNLLRKELGQWWGTRTWWIQTLIWVGILNGVSTIVMMTEGTVPGEIMEVAVQAFLPMSVGLVALGAVIAVQGAIVGEKELGTAAWVMSKPTSRYAFILAKIVAYAVGFGVTALVIPSALFVIIAGLVVGTTPAIQPFLLGVGIVALNLLFYLTLTLMLGTLYSGRGPVAAIGIGFVLTGLLLKSMIPMQVLMVTPWLLGDLSSGLALGMDLPPNWFLPIVATGFWIVLMAVVALWRFNREEF